MGRFSHYLFACCAGMMSFPSSVNNLSSDLTEEHQRLKQERRLVPKRYRSPTAGSRAKKLSKRFARVAGRRMRRGR